MSYQKEFTFYGVDGVHCVVGASTKEEAVTKYNKAFFWMDEGYTYTHYWNTVLEVWEKRYSYDIPVTSPLLQRSDLTALFSALYMRYAEINIIFENKNRLCLKHDFGIGYSSLYYAEYQKGTYCGDSNDEENQCHYFVTGSQCFGSEQISDAIDCFINRIRSEEPYKTFGVLSEKTNISW